MVATLAPLNSAECVVAYSTDNSSYTDFTKVLDFQPSGGMKKVIERRRLGQTTVEKFVARRDEGDLAVTVELENATYSIFRAAYLAETRYYIRLTLPDTGGTAGSKYVFDGYWKSAPASAAPGDDADMTYVLTMAVNEMTYTAGS